MKKKVTASNSDLYNKLMFAIGLMGAFAAGYILATAPNVNSLMVYILGFSLGLIFGWIMAKDLLRVVYNG